jgi:hypothetical protein
MNFGTTVLLLLSSFAASAQLLPPTLVIRDTAADSTGAMYFAGHVTAYGMSLSGVTQLQPFSPDCGFTGQLVQTCTHGYIAKVAPSGDRIEWSSTFGSDGQDSIAKIALASDGTVILAGTSFSKTIALTGYQRIPGSMFIARLSADGRTILGGTYQSTARAPHCH